MYWRNNNFKAQPGIKTIEMSIFVGPRMMIFRYEKNRYLGFCSIEKPHESYRQINYVNKCSANHIASLIKGFQA